MLYLFYCFTILLFIIYSGSLSWLIYYHGYNCVHFWVYLFIYRSNAYLNDLYCFHHVIFNFYVILLLFYSYKYFSYMLGHNTFHLFHYIHFYSSIICIFSFPLLLFYFIFFISSILTIVIYTNHQGYSIIPSLETPSLENTSNMETAFFLKNKVYYTMIG